MSIRNPSQVKDNLLPRPPVVTVMGHVDHGKTTLLSALKEVDLTRKEFGGISQHIGAYQINLKSQIPDLKAAGEGKTITFIDTPGHAAFTQMRARGAKVTDIVVLVVAADEGVKPQTKEALDHARAAGVPIIVAINKIDLPQADVERTKKSLADIGLTPEEWGGDTVTVEISAKEKKNLDQLLEIILLMAELEDLKADPRAPFEGVVIESQLDSKQGPVATILIKNGTLRVGDSVICDRIPGRIKAMFNDRGQRIREAGPSTPVKILGLDAVPAVGSEIKDSVLATEPVGSAGEPDKKTRERLPLKTHEAEGVLNVILKADVVGSLEAIQNALAKLGTTKKIRVLHQGTGDITESDVLLAQASKALILGFNVKASADTRHLARGSGVSIKIFNVIYGLIEGVQKALQGLEEEEKKEFVGGQAEVIKLFTLPESGDVVVGARVTAGQFAVGAQVEVQRDGESFHRARIKKIEKNQKKIVKAELGDEVGMLLTPQAAFKVGDRLATT